jgi:hypothetical protein
VWCQLDGEQPVPATVEEALARSGELTVKEIEVCKTWPVLDRDGAAVLPATWTAGHLLGTWAASAYVVATRN